MAKHHEQFLLHFFPLSILIASSVSLECKQCGHNAEVSQYFKNPEALKCSETVSWDCDNPLTTTPPPPPPPYTDTPYYINGSGLIPPNSPAAGPAPNTTTTTTAAPTNATTTGPTTTVGPTTPPPPPVYRELVYDNPSAPWACLSLIAAGGVMRRCVRTFEPMGCITIGLSKSCLCNNSNNCNTHTGSGTRKFRAGPLLPLLLGGAVMTSRFRYA